MAKASQKTAPKAAPSNKAVGFLASTAMSAGVGEKAIMAFQNIKEGIAEIKAIESENIAKRSETLKSLTMAFVKAARADTSIKLSDVHSKDDATSRAVKVKLEVAIGIRVATPNAEGGYKTEYAPWTADYFPQTGENKKDPDIRKKETFRTNFSTVFKKAIMSADGIVQKGIAITETKDGLLQLEGKAIKERFNQDVVVLNEKQTVMVGDKEVMLAKKPSFTEIARISADAAGTVITTRVQSAAKLGGAKVTEADIIAGIEAMTKTIQGLKDIGDKLASAIETLQEACETAIAENVKTAA
jgi:hypothetical protein